ncbi:DUF6265 family protein [Chitinophaga arvensicola]|uniref:DUF6265 domain-containing protein n=1 Tax=Chitinophaga arvensicola TaxID=29529 RepID=A0A1I0SDW0_9BACT|nr:DUF6265 family protein [Chitinophaga arvensicola]SEW57258.1 hypothetical protein SAMN04488122_6714 [Chitinophaga arvensicola]
MKISRHGCKYGLLIFLMVAGLRVAGQVRTADFPLLNKLEGTWKMNTRKSTIVETWIRSNDSTWTGKTWRVVGKDSALQQSMQVARRGEAIFYIPVYEGPDKPPAIRLQLRVLKAIGFVAEDLNNDFPKKITYRFKDDRHLDARVEGVRDGTIEEYIFQYSISRD